MRRGNTMGKAEYWSCNLYCTAAALLVSLRLFPELADMSWKKLWLFVGCCVGAGIVLTWKNRRNFGSVLVNVLLPLELRLIAAGDFWLKVIAAGAAVAAGLWLLLVLGMNAGEKENRRKVWHHGLMGGRTIFVCVFVLCCVPALLTGQTGKASAAEPVQMISRQEAMGEQRQTLRRFRAETWNRLTRAEKLEALQTVADLEAARLGIPHTLTVCAGSLPESVGACYSDSHREIRVNESRLETADGLRLLESVCHEAYHAYQFRLCDAWRAADPQYQNMECFADAPVFAAEFAGYISGTEDPEGYYNMNCEITARDYAREAAQEYQRFLLQVS